MRLNFRYKQGTVNPMAPAECVITNADTGEPVEMVEEVLFHMSADMVPHLSIEVIPSAVEIEAEAAETRRHLRGIGPVLMHKAGIDRVDFQ